VWFYNIGLLKCQYLSFKRFIHIISSTDISSNYISESMLITMNHNSKDRKKIHIKPVKPLKKFYIIFICIVEFRQVTNAISVVGTVVKPVFSNSSFISNSFTTNISAIIIVSLILINISLLNTSHLDNRLPFELSKQRHVFNRSTNQTSLLPM
jgi:hypothetical protein